MSVHQCCKLSLTMDLTILLILLIIMIKEALIEHPGMANLRPGVHRLQATHKRRGTISTPLMKSLNMITATACDVVYSQRTAMSMW